MHHARHPATLDHDGAEPAELPALWPWLYFLPRAPERTRDRRASAPSGSAWSREIRPDPVLLFRYSALTFNGYRIHYDRPYATQAEGYAGLVAMAPRTAAEALAPHAPAESLRQHHAGSLGRDNQHRA